MIGLMIAGAILGAAAGGLSTYNRGKRERALIAQQQRMTQQAHQYQQAYNDSMFNLQRNESLMGLGVQQNRLAQAFQTDLSGFNLGLEGQALQSQQARISLGDSTGQALAQQGSSGVKGSDTLQRQIDYSENLFNKQLGLQDQGTSLSMQGMTQQYTNQWQDIGREIDSWNPGGYRYEAKNLSDIYSQSMYGLQMQGYSWDMLNARPTGLDYFTSMFGGASQGANFGGSLGQMYDQMQGSSRR